MSLITKIRKKDILLKAFLWLYALVSLYPLIWMLFYSFKNNDEIFVSNPFGFPTHFRIENYITAWRSYSIPTYFLNSIIVTLIAVIGTLIVTIPFSYAIARMEWRLKDTTRFFITFGMFIPVQAIMIPLAIIVRNLHLVNTRWAVIIPYIAFGISFSAIVFYGFLRGIPVELEESACIDGANIFRTFFSIIIPIIKPSVATMTIFLFLQNWNEFPMAYILIAKEELKTLPLGLLFFQGQFTTDWGAMGACMVLASIPTVIVYLMFSDQVEKALTVGSAVKG